MAISLRIDKSFTYRGVAEKWSNKYHLSGANPADAVEWKAILDALVGLEKHLYSSATTVVYAAGYLGTSPVAVYTRDYTVSPDSPVAGDLTVGTQIPLPGDAAFWVRWHMGQLNSRGKKIYARKYFHDAYRGATGADKDSLGSTQKTNATTFSTAVNGFTVAGYSTRAICDKNGNLAVSQNVVTYVTTRTLKRRGGSPL